MLMVALSKNEYNENVYWNLRQNFRQIEGTSALFWFKVNIKQPSQFFSFLFFMPLIDFLLKSYRNLKSGTNAEIRAKLSHSCS